MGQRRGSGHGEGAGGGDGVVRRALAAHRRPHHHHQGQGPVQAAPPYAHTLPILTHPAPTAPATPVAPAGRWLALCSSTLPGRVTCRTLTAGGRLPRVCPSSTAAQIAVPGVSGVPTAALLGTAFVHPAGGGCGCAASNGVWRRRGGVGAGHVASARVTLDTAAMRRCHGGGGSHLLLHLRTPSAFPPPLTHWNDSVLLRSEGRRGCGHGLAARPCHGCHLPRKARENPHGDALAGTPLCCCSRFSSGHGHHAALLLRPFLHRLHRHHHRHRAGVARQGRRRKAAPAPQWRCDTLDGGEDTPGGEGSRGAGSVPRGGVTPRPREAHCCTTRKRHFLPLLLTHRGVQATHPSLDQTPEGVH